MERGAHTCGRPVTRARIVLLALPALLFPGSAHAQLISPGKLSAAHAEIEGIRNCTQCHVLRKPGISPDLCLACHAPLRARVEAGRGYHAALPGRDCAACHKEHFGADFALVRLDTLRFRHDSTGYALEGRHADAGCRACHAPARVAAADVRAYASEHETLGRTFLGLPTECATCHAEDDPHGGQFEGRACTECHDTGGWVGANGFDHDRAAFALTGRHRVVECAGCHRAPAGAGATPVVRYEGVSSARCTDCHTDEHGGAMPGRCETCHDTRGWERVDRRRVESTFDHRATGFVLEGAHAGAECAACHAARVDEGSGVRIRVRPGSERRAFPAPLIERGACFSCHVDPHAAAFDDREDRGDCLACHGQAAWLPAAFDAARHDLETAFPLEGAHRVVACVGCHGETAGTAPDFRRSASTCSDCHAQTDPHGGQFVGRECDACHAMETFRVAAFDHARTRFPLEGGHRDAPCASCHVPEADAPDPVIRYRPLGTECIDCHRGDP